MMGGSMPMADTYADKELPLGIFVMPFLMGLR